MEISSKNSISYLCLYCDKTFASNLDQENHVERDHKTVIGKGKGSRKSERITKNSSSSENSPFPGCFQCNKKTLRTDDLDSLFQHLLTSHQGAYFGCKCKIRTQDKVSLANHKKICKIGGGKVSRVSEENVSEVRKTVKKLPLNKPNGESKLDYLSDSDENSTAGVARTLPANAIHKKSDRSKLKNHSKNVNDKGRNSKSSSSSTTSTSTSRTGEEEYTIPLTRQKLKEPTIISRLGSTQNRNSSNKKSQKTNKVSSLTAENKTVSTTPSPVTKALRTKASKILNATAQTNPEPVESPPKNELSSEFDDDFYKNISQNVRTNISCFIDGKKGRLQQQHRNAFDRISEKPTPSTSATESLSATQSQEKEIHEATNFELSTPFPALLTAEQYGFGDSNPNKNKRHITKNSWKWKWDLIKKYKYVNEGGKIVKKVKQITTGLKDLSQLDMWTQLSMRSRYESLNSVQNESTVAFNDCLADSLSKRTIKTQNIQQLNTILDKCLTPEINIEQLEQTVIKLEPEEKDDQEESVEVDCNIGEAEENELRLLNLVKTNATETSKPLMSGEWARPRCYICIDCGLKFDLMKSLTEHKNSEHPYVVSAHYEIVGRENLEQELYKNLFLPKKALQTSGFARSLSVNSDSKSNETNEASTSSDNSSKFFADQKEKECSKCLKMIKYSSDSDIYKHILECIDDRVWMQAKRRSKYRRSRRKNRKTPRKSRLSIDQKKTTPSGSTKDNNDGDISTPSISNPPTPQTELPSSQADLPTSQPEAAPTAEKIKTAPADIKVNGKVKDGMNIKKFFKVNKSVPALNPRVIVQVLDIPAVKKPLRSSLRSSTLKVAEKEEDKLKGNTTLESTSNKLQKYADQGNNNSEEPNICDSKSPLETTADSKGSVLAPLVISTPEKASTEFPLSSPSNSSLTSPTSNSNVPKKKKKLNDCIAMLTCKIQEKLGVNFFVENKEPAAPENASNTPVKSEDNQEIREANEFDQQKLPSTSFQIDSLLKESSSFPLPVQDEVIDLSIKKKIECCESVIKKDEALEPVADKRVELKDSVATTSVDDEINHQLQVDSIETKIETSIEVTAELEISEAEANKALKAETPSTNSLADSEKVETVKADITTKDDTAADEKLNGMKENLQTVEEKPDVLEPEKKETEEPEVMEKTPDIESSNESMKISIPKDKIPNLKQILEQYQVITVNNIKISEEERRAFEEQKNRILQILNKTNSLTRKISKRKVVRKAPKRRKVAKKPLRVVKKSEPPKAQPAEVIPEKVEEKLEAKIEEVIKTTNRIRCRRLSVVVDPIINLSAFQNKNRKIRLTNNSQQNGFYELLAASEQIFSDNKPPAETKPCEVPLERVESNEISKPEPSTVSVAPEIAEKPIELPIEVKSSSKTRASKLSASKGEAVDESLKDNELSVVHEEPEVLPPAKDSTPLKKVRGKKQNMENIEKPLKAPAKICDGAEKVSLESELSETPLTSNKKSKAKKANTKATKKKLSPLEEIKVEQSVEVEKVKPSKKKKVTRKKPVAKQLDSSLSSDTSNENDVPLSRLIAELEKPVEVVAKEATPKIIEAPQELEAKEEKVVEKLETIVMPVVVQEELPKEAEVEVEEPKLCVAVKHQPIYSKAASIIDHSDKKSFDFTINEDSFFNDDIENDPSDKINDIVNNIINSSEFQIDSDTEKSESFSFKEQSPTKSQTLSSCSICKRTFRSDKGYEKHCLTPTHIMKAQRKNRCSEMLAEKEEKKAEPVFEKAPSPTFDETKIFRTKGALKTFDGILEIPTCVEVDRDEVHKIEEKAEPPKLELSRDQKLLQENDDKLYYEFKMEKKPEDMTPKDKDQLFDSLFSSLEVKSHENTKFFEPKSMTPVATPQDSELESSSTSWDLKQDADIEWNGEPPSDNLPFANAIKECYPKKFPVKINKSKDTAVSIPTKSLIMGKIFKKHRDSEKQKTPQADAPNNKPGIKNSLDEIFDHLKNSAEIDDKVLTCPSPKTLLKSAGGTFSPHSTTSSDMIETASQSNNNNNVYKTKPTRVISEKEQRKVVVSRVATPVVANDMSAGDVDDGAGKRKSRRRCAIKAKTFAETWSSDEYEELHDTEDIISIINEIEKRESIKKRKTPKPDDVPKKVDKNDALGKSESHVEKKMTDDQLQIRKQVEKLEERIEKRKSLQTKLDAKVEKASSFQIKKRRMSVKDGHKSDEETFTATKEECKPLKAAVPMKKRRMSCFVPSTPFEDKPKPAAPKQHVLRMEMETLKKFEKANEGFDMKPKAAKKSDSEKSFKNQKKFASLLGNFGCQLSDKKKSQKHRKRSRKGPKNIAYDSDSDFELHLKKSKASTISESSSSEDESEEVKADVITTTKHGKSQQPLPSTTSRNDMTMITEPKLLPNDLKQVVPATTNSKAAIPDDVADPSQNPCNRTKRHSSEKLYYWSSSSSESDQEQADTADGDNEDSVVPHQPEQHGWIVGDSHKKLVTLLAHAKIKNKIN